MQLAPFSVPFLSQPSPPVSSCVYTPVSHMRCYLVVPVQDVAELRFMVQQIKGRIPFWDN